MNKKKNTTNGNAVAAGIAGAVIGAGVAAAASKALSDKETRDKVKKTFSEVKKQVVTTVNKVRDTAEDMRGQMKEKAVQEEKTLKKKITTAKK